VGEGDVSSEAIDKARLRFPDSQGLEMVRPVELAQQFESCQSGFDTDCCGVTEQKLPSGLQLGSR
jgi:hypothetical protein